MKQSSPHPTAGFAHLFCIHAPVFAFGFIIPDLEKQRGEKSDLSGEGWVKFPGRISISDRLLEVPLCVEGQVYFRELREEVQWEIDIKSAKFPEKKNGLSNVELVENGSGIQKWTS